MLTAGDDEVEVDQSSQETSELAVVEAAGMLLVLVTLMGVEVVELAVVFSEEDVVLSAGTELEELALPVALDQSSQL